MSGKIDATPVKPWFPLIVADWLDSDDVQRMTTSERGVYITLLIHQWMLGRLPAKLPVLEKVTGVERRILGRFLGKYQKTFVEVSGNPEKIANRKLYKLQTGRDLTFFHSPEERREEEKQREESSLNEDRGKTEDVPTHPASRNRKSRASPDCMKCGGSGREVYREPNPKDPIGYNETSRECECVQ